MANTPRTAKRRPRVALIVETATMYGREIHRGIAEYMKCHEPWSVFIEERELGAMPPPWLFTRDWDGMICRPTTPALVRRFQAMGVPVVDLNDFRGNLGLPLVRSDNREIGRLAAMHLTERGFRNFAYCGFAHEKWADERRQGFVAAVQAAGCQCPVYESPRTGARVPCWDVNQARIAEWVRGLPLPVGISACNDLRGQHVLDACREEKLSVPEQVAVIGVDNDELLCQLSSPPLSTVVPNASRIGYEAAQMLDALMSGQTVSKTEILIPPVDVVTRQSTDMLAVADAEVASALQFIWQHACEGINMSDVLRHVPVSRSLLERRFRAAVGRTPHAEIRRVQLKQVARLLAETDLPLKRIAERCGFAHMEYLSYLFARTMGQPPGEYRRAQHVPTAKPS